MGKLYVLMGKSATGKDTLLYTLLHQKDIDIKRVIPYTTRPIRSGETHGKEYFFLTQEEMYELEEQEKIIECREYDTVHGPWFYFTVDDGQIDLKKGDYAMISTLEGYLKIRRHFGKENVVPIYITVDDSTRLERALERERRQKLPCIAEVCRRYLADEGDFSVERLEEAEISGGIVNDTIEHAMEQLLSLIRKKNI